MVCVSIQERDVNKCLEILKDVPMAEIRADLCQFSLPDLEAVVAAHPNLIVTCRIATTSEEYARERLITAIRKGARFVDVEIEAPVDFLEYIKVYAQVNGAKVIVSYHNYEQTPSLDELQQIASVCKRKGADIVKVVTTAHNITDAVRTLELYKMEGWAKEFKTNNYSQEKDVKLVAFAMGEAGKFTRYLSLKLGSPYTYCSNSNDSATAPGQYTVEQMQQLLKEGGVSANYKLSKTAVAIPCSKSVAQRAILAAAFARGKSVLTNFEPCNDIDCAIKVIEQFGCKVSCNFNPDSSKNELVIESDGVAAIRERLLEGANVDNESCKVEDVVSECTDWVDNGEDRVEERIVKIVTGESGLLTRLLVPFAAYLSGNDSADGGVVGNISFEINGYGSILKRNLKGAAQAVENAGAVCETTNGGYLPFKISGGINSRRIIIDGSESSQTVSGFLMTLPMLPFNTILQVENPASIPYINLTISMLDSFGIEIITERMSNGNLVFYIEGEQEYMPVYMPLEADWSSASFFAVAYAIASMLENEKGGSKDSSSGEQREYALLNMPLNTQQADEAVLQVLDKAGVKIDFEQAFDAVDFMADPFMMGNPFAGNALSGCRNNVKISVPNGLKAFEFDATNAPDLFPILAVLASFCEGESVIKGVNRLLQKESNRAESIFTEFTTLGAQIRIEDDFMYISGAKLHGGNVHSHNDHRIAMSIIIASLFIDEPVMLDEIKCIDKSFPRFLDYLSK